MITLFIFMWIIFFSTVTFITVLEFNTSVSILIRLSSVYAGLFVLFVLLVSVLTGWVVYPIYVVREICRNFHQTVEVIKEELFDYYQR